MLVSVLLRWMPMAIASPPSSDKAFDARLILVRVVLFAMISRPIIPPPSGPRKSKGRSDAKEDVLLRNPMVCCLFLLLLGERKVETLEEEPCSENESLSSITSLLKLILFTAHFNFAMAAAMSFASEQSANAFAGLPASEFVVMSIEVDVVDS